MTSQRDNPYAAPTANQKSDLSGFQTRPLVLLAAGVSAMVAVGGYHDGLRPIVTPVSVFDRALQAAMILGLPLVTVAAARGGRGVVSWLVVVPLVTAAAWVAFATLCAGATLATGWDIHPDPKLLHWSNGWSSSAVRLGVNSGLATFIASNLVIAFFRNRYHSKTKTNERGDRP